MPWYIYGILGALLSGMTVVFARSGLKDADPLVFATIRSVMMVGVLFFTLAIMNGWSHFSLVKAEDLKVIFLSALTGALSWVFFFIGLKKGNVAGMEVVDRMSVVFAVLFAFLFLGEAITLKSAIAVLLVLIGGLLIIF